MEANSTAGAANSSDSVLFKYKFSLLEESREGFGFSYFNLIAVTDEGALPVGSTASQSTHPRSCREFAS
jgi:hypothetical protein